jgi:hypothetical protein
MAYAKRSKARRPAAGKGGTYRKGAGGSGYRKPARAAGRSRSGGDPALRTIRIVIEQPGHNAVHRPDASGTVSVKPRKSQF